mmetsp:Transcript_142826/g.319361  ORF Transcript_142826/g.319361 Transcript_142826/m.319361 type:complete len:244 (-) Transcript_142826:361-1092(-)
MGLGQLSEACLQMLAHIQGVSLKLLAIHSVHHSKPRRRSNRTATEGVEVFDSGAGESSSNLVRAHDCCKGESVSEWLPHCHNVWDDPLLLKSPVMGAIPTKSSLHFVGNTYTTCLAHMGIDLFQVASRQLNDSGNTHPTLNKESSNLPICFTCLSHVLSVVLPCSCWVAVLATVGVGARHYRDVRRLVVFEFVRRYFNHTISVTVISPLHHNHLLPVRVSLCQADGQVIRFAAGIHEEAPGET